MHDEYISREAAIEEIDKWLDTVGTALVGKGLSYYGELIGCIEDAPAADVVPVVRCKDCIFRIEGRCFSRRSLVEPDNFCSWGATE